MPQDEDPRPVSVGVVGTGTITKEHLAYLSASPRTRLVAVADLSEASARYAAQRWGAAMWFTSHRELLRVCRPQVVHVCTPPTSHTQIVLDCLQAGAHVLCEKPLAPTRQELAHLQEVARQRGAWLIEDQNYRYNDPILRLQEIVQSGNLGVLREAEVRMALRIRDEGAFADAHLRSAAHDLPGGPIHDLLTHLVYLGLLFLPQIARPERVSAHWSNHAGDDVHWRWDDLDATLIAQGAHLRLRFSALTRPESLSITLRGEQGEAATDIFHPFLTVRVGRSVGKQLSPIVDHMVNGVRLAGSGAGNFGQKLMQHSPYHGIPRLLEAVYSALQSGGDPPISSADVDNTAAVLDALLQESNQR